MPLIASCVDGRTRFYAIGLRPARHELFVAPIPIDIPILYQSEAVRSILEPAECTFALRASHI